MNPRKKFKPRNSNSCSNSENELPSVLQGHIISNDRHFSSSKNGSGRNSPPKQRQNNCTKNSPNKTSPRGSPQKYQSVSPPTAKRQSTSPPTAKRQINFNLLPESKHSTGDRNHYKNKRSPRKHSPTQQLSEDFASPKLSFSSPNAADVPLPPTHWFSGCARQVLSESNISNQLKVLLNVA